MISVVSSRVRMKYPAKISRHAKLLFVVLGGDFSPGEVVAIALVILGTVTERVKNAARKMVNVTATKVTIRMGKIVWNKLPTHSHSKILPTQLAGMSHARSLSTKLISLISPMKLKMK